PPWGIVPADRPFLQRLQDAYQGDLLYHELDHLREHSVELQVVWLHHLLGDGFRVVPVLCSDPNGRGSALSGSKRGGVRELGLALGRLLAEDPEPTLVIAGADLSHVGGYFGDGIALEESFLQAVRGTDEAALA